MVRIPDWTRLRLTAAKFLPFVPRDLWQALIKPILRSRRSVASGHADGRARVERIRSAGRFVFESRHTDGLHPNVCVNHRENAA